MQLDISEQYTSEFSN